MKASIQNPDDLDSGGCTSLTNSIKTLKLYVNNDRNGKKRTLPVKDVLKFQLHSSSKLSFDQRRRKLMC